MARFQVLVTDSKKVLVTTAESIPQEQAQRVIEIFHDWHKNDDHTVIFMHDAELMRVTDVEIDESILTTSESTSQG